MILNDIINHKDAIKECISEKVAELIKCKIGGKKDIKKEALENRKLATNEDADGDGMSDATGVVDAFNDTLAKLRKLDKK